MLVRKPEGGVGTLVMVEWDFFSFRSPRCRFRIGVWAGLSWSLLRQLGALSPHAVTLPTRTEFGSFEEARVGRFRCEFVVMNFGIWAIVDDYNFDSESVDVTEKIPQEI